MKFSCSFIVKLTACKHSSLSFRREEGTEAKALMNDEEKSKNFEH